MIAENTAALPPDITIPVIDMAGLATASTSAGVARQLGDAARGIGFFYVKGHGIDVQVASLFDASHRLFALPQAEKEALSIGRSLANRGYVRLSDESLDPTSGKPDHKEAFNIGLELPPDDPELHDAAKLRGLNQWPAIDDWRDEVLHAYDSLWQTGRQLHRGFALDLGLPAGYFDPFLDKPLATLRMLRYPPQPQPARHTGSAGLGAGAHTDYGNLTLLATDTVGGLQVRRRDGAWLDAPHIPGALICNIGDCLMRWSNDVYVSTPHRVASPTRERYSVAFFLDANPDALVECLPGCQGPGRPPKYPPVTCAEYIRARLDATYAMRRPPGKA